MDITLDYIKSNFDKFNVKYFNGELITPKFKITRVKSYLGQLSWKYINGERTNYLISISAMFDRSDKDFCNTILHEMIHLYIRQNNIKDTRPHHGRVFYQIADRINQYGWNISRCDSTEGCELTSKEKVTYNMVTYINRNGKYFLMRYNKKKESFYLRLFMKCKYKGIVWFTSTDNKKYAHFPECRTGCRGRFITKGEYDELAKENKYSDAV